MGILRIEGTIDVKQFWPTSSSDADTTKIKLEVGKNSFKFSEDGETFKTTHVFEDARAVGQGIKDVIHTSKKDGTRTITVRLQGIDAPELHYRAAPLRKSPDISDTERAEYNALNKERRQCYAETSTVALCTHLEQFANEEGILDAVFDTYIDFPFEAVDTYGRFVGNIFVGKAHDVNIWLVENGWGLPAFYTSMSNDEINQFLDAWEKGKKKKSRPASAVSLDAGKFDWKMMYRKPGEVEDFEMGDDKGKALMPKIFRRQVAWMVAKKAGAVTNSTPFSTFLRKSPDQLILLDDFMENGVHAGKVINLHDFIDSDNKVQKKAEEFVFKEKPSSVINANGKSIKEWFPAKRKKRRATTAG